MNKKITRLGILLFISLLGHVVMVFPLTQMKSPIVRGFYQYNAWTNDNGLPMNTVMAIAQTPDGYLWLGTETGLARFDGVKFEVFSSENVPAFSCNLINALLVDSKGTLWIVTQLRGIIRCQNRKFEAFNQYSHLVGKEIWCVMESPDKSIWIGSSRGVFCWADERMTKIPLPGNLSSTVVRALAEDREGRVWVGTRDDGVILVKKTGDSFETDYIGPKGTEITTLFVDRKGALWIGTQDCGLTRYWQEQRLSFTTANGLTNNTIRAIYESPFGNLWIGTNSGGINILEREIEDSGGKTPARNFTVLPEPKEFTSDVIISFFEDREGTLWIGTNGGGLYNLRESKIITYTNKNGLSFNNVYGVFHDSHGRVWMGSKGYGVNYYDFKESRFYTLTTRDGLSSDSVLSFSEDPGGALWFGTLGGGINRLKDGNIQVFDFRHGLSSNVFRAVYADPEGNIWAGSAKGEIYRFSNNRFTLAANVISRVNTMHKDSRGNLWAGTLGNGLCRLEVKSGKLEVFNEEKGMSNNIVCCIHEDAGGILWIGTLNGLNRWQNGKLSAVLKKHGLPDDTVYWIIEDHKHDFWISSNQGIYCLRRKEIDAFFNGDTFSVNPIVFGKESGMQSMECNGGNHPAGCKTHDGKIWFPTTCGVSVVDPVNISINKIPPPVLIEKIIINGQDYPLSLPSPVVVSPGYNILEIHYTALSFIAPGKIRFKYKMEGHDKAWIDADKKRTAFYSNLPPGQYTFRVTACNSEGIWNNTGTWMEIHLKSSFFRTPAFIIGVLLAVTGLFVILYYYFKKCKFQQQFKPKTRISKLGPEETNEYIKKLIYLLEVEQVYKDPNISIKSLASRLLISTRNLSNLINDRLHTNFIDLVSEYRIKEAQRLLKEAKTRDKSIINIAYNVGYHYKSAFNRAFKSITGMTPSEFRKKTPD
jgi:ligand-binding sensor domain-containing protein/AraC-like DNA-binding protein